MTDLDDALNSSAPEFYPVVITAEWQELPPNYSPGVSPVEDLRDLGQQIGPDGYTVTQSLDDGLPDPVTMTSQNDASGKIEASLVGRQRNRADVLTFRSPMTGGNGTGTTITITPDNTSTNDYATVAVTIVGLGVTITDGQDLNDPNRWQLLAKDVDGSLQLLVYGRKQYTGAPGLVLTLSASSTWVWTGVSVFGETFAPTRAHVPILPGLPVTAVETVSRTDHTIPGVHLSRRGWILGFFVNINNNAWVPVGDNTELTDQALAPRLMMMRSTNVRDPGWTENTIANTAVAIDTAVMIAIPLEVRDRERMDAMQYFSPFNEDSPIVDFERDTASVILAQPVVTPNGPYSVPLFAGVMADITLKGRVASLAAVSQTRLALDRSLSLPTVYAYREGLEIDWLVTWLMARGGQFAGSAPSAYTRKWATFYGSVHLTLGGPLAYCAAYRYTSAIPGSPQGYKYPTSVTGPFVSGMFAKYRDTEVLELGIFQDRSQMPGGAIELGFDPVPLHSNDILSQANNQGRLTFWVRGDATDVSPAALVGVPTGDYQNPFWWVAAAISSTNEVLGRIDVFIDQTRQLSIRMGSSLDGYGTIVLTGALPNDGLWHFIAVAFDWDACSITARMDSTTWTSSAFHATTDANLPLTEEALYVAKGYISHQTRSHLPIADLQVEWGAAPFTDGISGRFWPTLALPSKNSVYRRSGQKMEVIAEATPLQGWETLKDCAQSSLANYRTDETDNFNFLALEYFGETAQMTPSLVADTQVNAADLDVTNDPTKTRNVVTLEYPETRVDSKTSRVLEITAPVELPKGITALSFPLDTQAAEIHGAADPYGGTALNLSKLSAAQIASPTTIPTNIHFMTPNTASDGTGVVWGPSYTSLTARITGYTSSQVTVEFTNSTPQVMYLANNGDDVPSLCILGYAIKVNTSYTTQRDTGSINNRRERALSAAVKWVQRRDEAEIVANTLVNLLSRPRAEVTVEVMGDPRRIPGQMVTLADSQGTQAAGNWRILSIEHRGNGAQFTQLLKLVRVYPTATWDGLDGWDLSVWAE